MPTLRNLYRESYFGAGLAPTVGNPDLKPEKTVLYEFGFQQQFGNLIGMDFNVFHKDIRELLALQSIRYNSPNYGPSNYSIYLNKDYGSKPLGDLLEYAIGYAADGYPVGQRVAFDFENTLELIKGDQDLSDLFLINGKTLPSGFGNVSHLNYPC